MMVLRHISAVLCEMFSITSIMADEYVEDEPLHRVHTQQDLNPLDFYLQGQNLIPRYKGFISGGDYVNK
jgi:hypothetical protein